MFARLVPPTATPLRLAEWQAGLHPGPEAVTRFRHALADYLGVDFCQVASSGRTAFFLLLAALRDLPASQGRAEIILPAYTCPSLAKVVLDAGLTPHLVDIDPHTHNFVAGALEASIGPSTLAVVCVHPYGLPQPVAEVVTLAHDAGAVVIEDAAQALGARWAGRPVGTHGDFGLFSLGPGKPLSTGGGGVVCTTNRVYAAALARRWQDIETPRGVNAGWALARLGLFSLAFHPTGWWLAARAGAQKVGESEASWGYTLTGLADTQAAVGLRLLPVLDAINAARRRRAQAWLDRLQGIPHLILPAVPGAPDDAIYLRLPLLVEGSGHAGALQARLAAAGIGAGRMYRRTLDAFFPDLRGPSYPGARQVACGLITLPTNHYVTLADIERGADLLRQTLSHQ